MISRLFLDDEMFYGLCSKILRMQKIVSFEHAF